MTAHRLSFYFAFAILAIVLIGLPIRSQYMVTNQASDGLSAGRNVNMVSGLQLPLGDPFLQRQNEPSIAVSTRNPLHILAGANDYRTVDMLIPYEEIPGYEATAAARDAWLGLYKSYDGGQSWISTLLPGFPLDSTSQGSASPLKAYGTGADPVVRAGTNGMFYYAGLAFNRNVKGNSLFVARLIDNNNAEDKNSDQIKYIDAKIIDTGTPGQFIDKPWMAVDIPRGSANTVAIQAPGVPLQYVAASNVYLAYAIFTGQAPPYPFSRVYFVRSTDCGKSWGKPTKLSESSHVNQGVTIAIAPSTGNVYVAWRRFPHDNSGNAIMFCYSTDGGVTFSKGEAVADVLPFDQGTTATSFRTNSYPSLTVDHNGLIYLAWSQRGVGPEGDARIVVMTSMNGVNWSQQQAVDNHSGRGHQFWPTLSYAAGIVTAAWHDQRRDASGLFSTYINDVAGMPRHTTDVRAAQAPAGGWFGSSIQVSRYLFWIDEEQNLYQIHYNPPNFPLFKEGTRPFHGDYIDLTPAPMFVPTSSGGWTYNTDGSKTPVFHAAWTDNRNVKPPADGDWTNYTPPTSTQDALFDSDVVCAPGRTGMRNQDVYTSSLTGGLIVGSPGNSKPLDSAANTHTFVVFAKNMTQWQKKFRLAIAAPSNVTASFKQFEACPSLLVDIAPYSSISRTVFANSSVRKASFKVDVVEVDANGDPVSGGLKGTVILNPDIENPDIENPDIENYELHNPDIENPDIENPDIENVIMLNPDIENPDIENMDIINPDIENPDIENPDIENPDIENEAVLNPDIENPDIENPDIENGAIYDYTWKVKNVGNTTSAYAFKMISAGFDESKYPGFGFQLLIYRVHTSPVAIDCILKEQHSDELIANIVGPVIFNPDIENPDIENPDIENPDIENATFWLAPDDQAYITLRWYDPNKNDQVEFDPEAEAVEGVTTAQAVNSENEHDPDPTPPVATQYDDTLVIYTSSPLPTGTIDTAYATYLVALGATPPYTWSIASGSLPAGLSLDSATGAITGTPTAAGTANFTVQVEDSGSSPQTVTKNFDLMVSLKFLTSIPNPSFEEGSGTWPDGWEPADTEATYIWTTGTNRAIGIMSQANYGHRPKWRTIGYIAVEGGREYQFNLKYRWSSAPDSTETARLSIYMFDASLNQIGVVPRSIPYAMPTWRDFSANVPVPAGTAAIRIFLERWDSFWPPSSGEVYFDDIKMKFADGEDWVNYAVDFAGEDFLNAVDVDSGGEVYAAGGEVGSTDCFTHYVKILSSGILRYIASDSKSGSGTHEAIAIKVHQGLNNVYYAGTEDYGTLDYSVYMKDRDPNIYRWWESNYDGLANNTDMANAMAVESSGNVYVTGKSWGINYDYATIKYDALGNVVWTAGGVIDAHGAARYDYANGPDIATAIAVDNAGNVYVTGMSDGYLGPGITYDFATIKYDSNGNQLWVQRYDMAGAGGEDRAYAIAIDDLTGNVYVSGSCDSSAWGWRRMVTLKYSPGGALLATHYIDNAMGLSMALDRTGIIFVTGISFGSTDDYVTVGLDFNLSQQWIHVYDGFSGTDRPVAVGCDHSGNGFVTGSSQGLGADLDIVTIKYDSSGTPVWIRRYDGFAGGNDEARGIAVTPAGIAHVAGKSWNSSASGYAGIVIRYKY
jgi:hypothetical protein